MFYYARTRAREQMKALKKKGNNIVVDLNSLLRMALPSPQGEG